MTALLFRVEGVVQGVGFRAWTCETARACGLVGFVRNVRDGAVEGAAYGAEQRLRRFVDALHTGPPSARVTLVKVRPTTARCADPSQFRFAQTAPAPTPDWPEM